MQCFVSTRQAYQKLLSSKEGESFADAEDTQSLWLLITRDDSGRTFSEGVAARGNPVLRVSKFFHSYTWLNRNCTGM